MATNRNQHTPCFGVQLNTDSRNKGLRFGCGALGGGKTRTTAYVQRVRSSCGSAVVQWRAGSRRSDVRPFDGQQKVRRAMFIQRAGINISSIHNEWDLVYESDEQAESSERCAAKLMVSRNYAKRSARRRKSATEQCANRKSALELWNTTIRIIEGIL